uniref:ribosomal protein L22 n=1 Tax=Nekemias arborea TaxID=345093 RepID=UPI001FA78C18|nr:ribosomal protein L22 [Nekemias arborea]UNA63031.1 ribosomal protein L22 [Nekemias arborea]
MVNMVGNMVNNDPFIFSFKTHEEILQEVREKEEREKEEREKEDIKLKTEEGKREKEILKEEREKEDIKLKTEVYALSQSISMSAHKARRVVDQIRGRSYQETLMILELMPYRACYPIFKLIYSAAANAKHNMGLNEEYLVIIKAVVNEGTTVKKLKPRARGRSFPIKRPTCHITIVLKDTSLYEQYV